MKVFGDVPPVDSEPASDLPAEAPAVVSSKPASASRTGRKRQRTPRRTFHDDSKPAGLDDEDLAYWMDVFGDSPAGSASRSADELRVADLENWLKRFEANEGLEGD